jgi:hypothetical protein
LSSAAACCSNGASDQGSYRGYRLGQPGDLGHLGRWPGPRGWVGEALPLQLRLQVSPFKTACSGGHSGRCHKNSRWPGRTATPSCALAWREPTCRAAARPHGRLLPFLPRYRAAVVPRMGRFPVRGQVKHEHRLPSQLPRLSARTSLYPGLRAPPLGLAGASGGYQQPSHSHKLWSLTRPTSSGSRHYGSLGRCLSERTTPLPDGALRTAATPTCAHVVS